MTGTDLVIAEPILTTLRFRKAYTANPEHLKLYMRFHELLGQPLTPAVLMEIVGITARSEWLWKKQNADLKVLNNKGDPSDFDDSGPSAA